MRIGVPFSLLQIVSLNQSGLGSVVTLTFFIFSAVTQAPLTLPGILSTAGHWDSQWTDLLTLQLNGMPFPPSRAFHATPPEHLNLSQPRGHVVPSGENAAHQIFPKNQSPFAPASLPNPAVDTLD